MLEYINDNIEISSDREDSDEENSNKKNSDEENYNEENYINQVSNEFSFYIKSISIDFK